MIRILRMARQRWQLLQLQTRESVYRLHENIPLQVWRQYRTGKRYLFQGLLKQAELSFKRVLAAKPRHFRAQARLGEVYRLQGNLLAAMNAYAKAYLLNPRRYAYYNLLREHLQIIHDVQQVGMLGDITTRLRTCAGVLSLAAQRLQLAVQKQQRAMEWIANAQQSLRRRGASRRSQDRSTLGSGARLLSFRESEGLFDRLEAQEHQRFLAWFTVGEKDADEDGFSAAADPLEEFDQRRTSGQSPNFGVELHGVDWDAELRNLRLKNEGE